MSPCGGMLSYSDQEIKELNEEKERLRKQYEELLADDREEIESEEENANK